MSSVDYPRERDATAIDVGGGDHGPSALAGEEVRRQRLDDTRHKLGELNERWNNRLVVEKVSLLKAYLDGRLSVCLIVEICGTAVGDGTSVCHDAEVVLGKWPHKAVVVYGVRDGSKGVVRDEDHSMLVEVVQFVESPQGVIPSTVRLYRLNNETTKLGADLLFKSTVNGLFKFLPSFMHWEMHVGIVTAQHADDFGDSVVKGTSKIVDGVANHCAKVGNGMPEVEAEVASFRVFIDERGVVVRRHEGNDSRLRLLDVMIGPFNLSSRT
jgi:hypothetical protein